MHSKFFVVIILACMFLCEMNSVYGKEKKEWAPDFMIVGAQKSGTGSLRKLLIQHPLIVTSIKKELHFFDGHFDKGVQWYKAQFPERPSPNHLIGQKCPYYIVHPLVPERVFSLYPNVKIIMILRNPVSRAYSHYHFNVRREVENLSFEEAIKAEPKRLAGQEKKIAKDPLYRNLSFRRYSYLRRGIYVDQISRWLSYFPREQILIITTEDFSQDPLAAANEVFAFLGLSPMEDLDTSHRTGDYKPMDPMTRKQLVEFFRPYNRQLSKLLDRDFSSWDE